MRAVLHCLLLTALCISASAHSSEKASAGARLKEAMKERIYPVGIDSVESARAALEAGAEVLFLSGSWVSATLLNKPDTGFYKLEHAAELSRQILEEFPNALLLVDIDSGFGDMPSSKDIQGRNIARTLESIKVLKEIGVAGVVPDDQEPVARKADVQKDKQVISRFQFTDMMENVRKAAGDDFVVVGRTAAENKSEAIERAKMLQKFSDLVIVEALNEDKAALIQLKQQLPNIPLSTIQIDKGQEALWTAADHSDAKLSMVLMPTSLRRFELESEGGGERVFDINPSQKRLFELTGKSSFRADCVGRMISSIR